MNRMQIGGAPDDLVLVAAALFEQHGKGCADGAVIGAVSGGGKGALIGSGAGGAAGLAIAMLTRGNDVRLDPGTGIEMIFQRPLTLDAARVEEARTGARP